VVEVNWHRRRYRRSGRRGDRRRAAHPWHRFGKQIGFALAFDLVAAGSC